MGLYNDYRNINRDSWNYTYTGNELLAYAERKKSEYKRKEGTARSELADLLNDKSVSASDKRIEDLRQKVENYADLYEKCVVWCWEFSRSPDKEFTLKLGDVSFFDIPEEMQRNS